MSSFTSLEIGKRSLLAQNFGIDTTSNNIANVNTPGYSRRSALLSETSPYVMNGKFLGTGVVADKLRTFREEFFDREFRSATSRKAGYETDEQIMQRIESILAEPSDMGLNELVSKFLNSFDELGLKPENVALRQYLLDQSQTLVERFHTVAQQIADTRKETLNSLSGSVDRANSIIQQIAGLNKDIASSKAKANGEVQTYVDKRELLLEQLSELGDVSVSNEDNGTVNVSMNGINLVTGTEGGSIKLIESANSATGERTATLYKLDESGNPLHKITPQTGKFASLTKTYNELLDDKDSSGSYSIPKKVDDFVNALVQKVNAFTVGGYGLDDTSSIPPGRSFFAPTTGPATAFTIEISGDIKNNPRNIPLSGAPGEPGNNEVARQISRLVRDSNFLDGATPTEFYTGFLGKIGNLGNDATTGKETTRLVADQLSNQRESVVGVNLDEEAVSLIKFQKAFEASSRIVNVTNELLTTIVNLGR